MRNFKALLKAQFLSFLSGMGGKSKTKKLSLKNKGAKYVVPILLCGVIFASAYLYTKIFHEILSLTGVLTKFCLLCYQFPLWWR